MKIKKSLNDFGSERKTTETKMKRKEEWICLGLLLLVIYILSLSAKDNWNKGYDKGYIEGEGMGLTKGFLDCEMIYK